MEVGLKIEKGVELQKQVQKLYEERRKMLQGEIPINWGFAEMAAYATLLDCLLYTSPSPRDV